MPDWLTADLRGQLIDGAVITVAITIATSILSLLVGTTAAVARRSPRTITRRIAATFVEVFRNVPALIWVIAFAFAVPNLVPVERRKGVFFDNGFVDAVGDIFGLPLPYYALAATMALTFNTGAHLAEVLRSGMAAIPAERIEAARTLGASRWTATRTTVIPDGFRLSFPAVSNRLVHNLKNTALVSFVAVPDLFGAIQGLITKTFRASELLVIAAIGYLLLSSVLTFALQRVEAWLWRGRAIRRELGV